MVDLNKCVYGDKLLSRQRTIFTYIKRLHDNEYYDHVVRGPNNLEVTRTNDGFVYRNQVSRKPEIDHDIIGILKDDPVYNVSVGNDVVFVGFKSECKEVLNILYEYYKDDKPIPSIIMTNQKDTIDYKWIYGSEQTYIEKCLDSLIDFKYGD